jgi:hypothetical protein
MKFVTAGSIGSNWRPILRGVGWTFSRGVQIRNCAGLLALFLAFTTAAEAGAMGFTLENHSDDTLVTVHVSPDWKRDWGNDHLGGGTIGPGERTFIVIVQEDSYCYFDVLVGNDSGGSHTFWFVDACERETLTYSD